MLIYNKRKTSQKTTNKNRLNQHVNALYLYTDSKTGEGNQNVPGKNYKLYCVQDKTDFILTGK